MQSHDWRCGLMAALGALLMLIVSAPGWAAQPERSPMLGLPTQGLRAEGVTADKLVFAGESDWVEFWKKHGDAAAPLVDFSQWQIVAVFLGAKPNSGYGVEITGYAVSDGTIEVQYAERQPVPGKVYAQVIVHPYDIVAVPAGGKVSFKGAGKPQEQAAGTHVPVEVLQTPPPSAALPPQYLLIGTQQSWRAFWTKYFGEEPPTVDFSRAVVAGDIPPADALPVKVSSAVRVGEKMRVFLGAGTPGAAAQPLLVVVPRAARVDFVTAAPATGPR